MHKETKLTMERVHPDMVKPINMLKIMTGKTEMFPFFPPGTLQIWLEHKNRYLFAKNFCNGLTLDIACGTGYGKQVMNLNSDKYVGVDIEHFVTSEALDLNKGLGRFINANGLNLPFKNNLFDTVLSFETIEHIPYLLINKYLTEIKRILKPQGEFIVSTPNREVFSPNSTIKDQPNLQNHCFEFSPKEFEILLRKHFRNIELYRQGDVIDEDIKNPSQH